MACQHWHNEDAPRQVLGLDLKKWTIAGLKGLLDHYGRPHCRSANKGELFIILGRLSQERGLTVEDRREFFKTWQPVPRLPVIRPNTPLREIRGRQQIAVVISPVRHPAVANAVECRNLDCSNEMECSICMESCNEGQIPSRRITALCTHEGDVCLSCISRGISSQFETKMWDQIGCPWCGQLLSHSDVKAFADPAIFDRYQISPFS